MNFWQAATGITYENLDMTSNWLRRHLSTVISMGQWVSVNKTPEKQSQYFWKETMARFDYVQTRGVYTTH
jgi:hypothetical protein